MPTSMVAHSQNNTPVDSSCRIRRSNDGIQQPEDEITRADTLRWPFCFTTDPLLLTPFQEVSKKQYYHHEQKQRRKQGCYEDDEFVRLGPAPSPAQFDAFDPFQETQHSGQALTPVYHTLWSMMEHKPTQRTARQNNGQSEHYQKQKKVIPESYCLPLQAGTIVKENKNDSPSQGSRTRTEQRSTSKQIASSKPRELPKGFVPGPWSVIVGRDRASLQAPGNKHLRRIVRLYLHKYARYSNSKDEKTRIISEIESIIRRNCAKNCEEGHQKEEEQGPFIKFQEGRWWEVSPSVAREKIGRIFRESLHTKYSSSSRRKRERRFLLQLKAVDMKKDVPSTS